MSIFETLQSTGLPCAYSHFKGEKFPSYEKFITYIGSGQNNFNADDTYYHSENGYQIEYYFTEKDETTEKLIESKLLENGFLYDKSEDVYIEDEGIFVIYYTV